MTAIKESKILKLFSRPFVTFPILLVLIAISYINTLYSPFVLDDIHSFLEEPNVFIRDYSFDSLSKLSRTVFGKARYIPMLTFSLNHFMAKGQMPIYHITNIVIHLLTTLAVYWLARTLLKTPVGSSALRSISATYFSFFIAALWALNPVQTNAVTYIVQRMTSLSTLFYITALTLYVKGRLGDTRSRRGVYYLFSFIMAVCAFHSKENSFLLPVAILLVEWMFITPNLLVNTLRRIKGYHWLGIFFLTAVLLPLAEHPWAKLVNYDRRSFDLAERLLTQARVVVHYISLLVLPLPGRMNFDYDFPISISIFSPLATFFSLVLLGVILIWSFRIRRQYPFIAFGVFWFFLNLLVESSVIPLELVFEHRLYLPSVGFYIVVLSVLDLFVANLKTKHSSHEVEQLFVLGMIFIVTLFSIGTSLRNYTWRDSYTLYKDCAQKAPNKPRVLQNLGVAMGRDRDLERESIEVFEKAIALGAPHRERYVEAANNIVVALINLGEIDEAITRGKKYLDDRPPYISGMGFSKLMYNLAYAHNTKGQYSESMQLLVRGIQTERKKLNNYLVILMEATLASAYDHEEYREKLQLTDENGNKMLSVKLRMARLLLDLRVYGKAREFLQSVIKSYPEHELAKELNEKSQNQIEKNQKQRKLMSIKNHPPYKTNKTYKRAIDLSNFIQKYYTPLNFSVPWLLDKAEKASQPDDPFVLWYRIKWYMKTGEKEKIVQGLEQSIKLQKDFIPLLNLIGEYYELLGEHEKAAEIFSRILELYPGEPDALKYEQRILEYTENKTTP